MINCRAGEMRLLAISPFIACSREDKLAGRRSPHTFCVDLSLSQLASPNPPTGTQGDARLLVCLSFGMPSTGILRARARTLAPPRK